MTKKIERAVVVASALTAAAWAQPRSAWAEEEEPPPSSQAPIPPVPPPAPSAAVASPPPAAPPAAPPPVDAPKAAVPVEKEAAWYERLDVGAFVDAYYAHNWRSPRPNEGANGLRAFDTNTGFGVTWLGLDAAVAPDPVGAQLQLRFGAGSTALAVKDASLAGMGFVQNANVSLRPGGKDGKLTLVLGKFDTLYGAEVPQSQLNVNYTRGLLYTLAQPYFHTGLRADYQVAEQLAVKLLVVNGWNETLDNNRGKSVGGQVTWTPSDRAAVSLGYLGGAEEDDTTKDATTGAKVANVGAESRLRHLADLIVDVHPFEPLRLVANATYVTQAVAGTSGPDGHARWYGAALYGRYALDPSWAIAARGEYVRDPEGQTTTFGAFDVGSGTLTLEHAVTKYMLIRLDDRIDVADAPVFGKGLSGISKSQLTTTLGVVVKTN